MATHFGEVLFPSSRAFWDGYDEEDLTDEFQVELELVIKWLKDKPTSIEKLILIEGSTITDFSKECLCHNSIEVCTIEDQHKSKLATIYQASENRYVCIIAPTFDTKLAGELVLKISDIICISKSIYLVTWRHVSQYKSENVPTVPSFLRCLYTKTGRDLCKSHKEVLEQPNIIYGVAAGVLSYAQMKEIQSVLYVLYTDSIVLDSEATEPLIKIFAEITGDALINITSVGNKFFYKGNLYM